MVKSEIVRAEVGPHEAGECRPRGVQNLLGLHLGDVCAAFAYAP